MVDLDWVGYRYGSVHRYWCIIGWSEQSVANQRWVKPQMGL